MGNGKEDGIKVEKKRAEKEEQKRQRDQSGKERNRSNRKQEKTPSLSGLKISTFGEK